MTALCSGASSEGSFDLEAQCLYGLLSTFTDDKKSIRAATKSVAA